MRCLCAIFGSGDEGGEARGASVLDRDRRGVWMLQVSEGDVRGAMRLW